MPNPAKFKDEGSWMSACMTQAKKEGRPRDQSIAMCLNMWRKEKGKPPPPHVKKKKKGKKYASEILREIAWKVLPNE